MEVKTGLILRYFTKFGTTYLNSFYLQHWLQGKNIFLQKLKIDCQTLLFVFLFEIGYNEKYSII